MAHVGAFAGGVDEEGVPMTHHFQATSPRDCFEEALYGCLALVYTHRHTTFGITMFTVSD